MTNTEIRTLLADLLRLYQRRHESCQCFDCEAVVGFCKEARQQLQWHAEAETERAQDAREPAH